MCLAAAFAMSALLLASLGIYGVIAFAVARRTPEMGIRIALGANAPRLVRMVVRQGMLPVAAGLGVGLVCARFVSRLIASQLYGVAPDDPVSIELYNRFRRCIIRRFKRVGAFRVGPEALEMLKQGARLTQSVRNPAFADLTVEPSTNSR